MPPRADLGWPWAIPISPKNCYTSPRSPQFKWAEAIRGRHQACASPPGELSTAFALLKDPYFPRLAFVSFLPGCYYCLQGRAIPREAAICGDISVVRVAFARVVPFDFDGLCIRELTPAELQSASVAAIDVPPGAGHRRARSSKCDKLYVCIQGLISSTIQDREITLQPKDTLYVPKCEWFGYRNECDEPSRPLLVHVPPFDLASEEFEEFIEVQHGNS